MTSLGHERFSLVGHDRGSLYAFRLALDHPSRVTKSRCSTACPSANTLIALWDARSASASCWGPRRHREGSTLCCPPAMVRLWIDGCLPVAVMVGEDAR
jgi:hypothetical protein